MSHVVGRCDCWSCETAYLRAESARDAQDEYRREIVSGAIDHLIELLDREGVPLGGTVTVAALIDDICTLAGIPTPPEVGEVLGDPDPRPPTTPALCAA